MDGIRMCSSLGNLPQNGPPMRIVHIHPGLLSSARETFASYWLECESLSEPGNQRPGAGDDRLHISTGQRRGVVRFTSPDLGNPDGIGIVRHRVHDPYLPPGRSATRPADSKRISSSASLCPGCAFMIPQSPNRLTAPLLTPLNARARYSGCRPNDSWVELDTESQHQTKDNPAEYDQQRNAEDLDQRGLQGLSGIVGPRDRPPVDIDCAHAGPDERDERQQPSEHQRLPRRSGALGREIGTRGETKLR